ncbi:DUF881 domain-containing protein [Salibacterium aidingense]|uniref:DUF881 domain-containing protein n=1 Tax=Salibacterium aidingense TaxID=384933 RepID=UPI0003FEE622|nr:DUF881 domain-containing protein [Salibacterium aidingense]
MRVVLKTAALLLAVVIGYYTVTGIEDISFTKASDSGDILQLQKALQEERERRQELYDRIRENEKLLEEYSTEQKNSREYAMKQAVEDLEEKAGMTEKSGQGVEVTISSAASGNTSSSFENRSVRPELLRQLVNELKQFGASDISMEGQRVLETTPFREIDGITHINGKRLPGLPVQIKVLAENADTLYNELMVSESSEYFSFENMELRAKVKEEIHIPAFEEVRRVRYMEVLEEDS